jgi:predicted amidophosphoribosyltransferase
VKVCRSCGGPLSGTELFCGICGIPIQSAPPGLPASQPQAGKTCSNCGKPIRVTTRFCGACGMAVGSK